MQTHTIDASNKVLGRLAAEIACLLAGKDRIDYAPNRIPGVRVRVTNAEKIRVTGKKFTEKRYFRHSGYPGGARSTSFKELFARDPRAVLRLAVSGMLAKNKLRARALRGLEFHRGPITNNQ